MPRFPLRGMAGCSFLISHGIRREFMDFRAFFILGHNVCISALSVSDKFVCTFLCFNDERIYSVPFLR